MKKFHWDSKYLQGGISAFLVICASLLFYFGIFHMSTLLNGLKVMGNIMMPVICGFAIAYVLVPVINFLENKLIFPFMKKQKIAVTKRKTRVIRYICVLITLVLAGYLIYALIAMIVPSILESVISIIYNSPRYIQNIGNWIENLLENNPQWGVTAIDLFDKFSAQAELWLTQDLLPQLRNVLQQLSSSIVDVLIFFKNILIGAIISIYLLVDKEGFVAQGKMFLYSALSLGKANQIIRNLRFVHKTFGGFISGKIIDSLIIGGLCYIGTSILNIPYAILVSVVVGVTNVIPFFGPYLGAIPSAFLILLVSPVHCLYFVIFIVILQQFDGNILGPKILGESTGLSSFMVIVSILLFGGIFGILGMFIGVPVCAVIYAALKVWREKSLDKKELPLEISEYMNIDHVDETTLQPIFWSEETEETKSDEMKKDR